MLVPVVTGLGSDPRRRDHGRTPARTPRHQDAAQALTDVTERRDIDWQAAQARWGTGFPQDYMAFMSVYGVGSITSEEAIGQIEILGPFPSGSHLSCAG
jgi:hypothetical protein